jgi:hypothetical protein
MKFKVTKSTLSTKGGFVNTLEGESSVKVFGVNKTVKHIFLMKTDEQVPVDTTDDINLSDYTQETYKWVDDEGKDRTSTWLHKKAA